MNQSDMKEAVKTAILQHDHVLLNMRERIFFTHSDPHGAAPSHGRFLTGMPDDGLLQRLIVA
jgi:hypothetical protein